MCRSTWSRAVVLAVLVACSGASAVMGQAPTGVHRAVLGEPNQPTAEVSTEELRRILADRTAFVFDARPHREFAISHIPGALNVAAKPGVPMSAYVSDAAEIGRLVGGDRNINVVLYCNGPYCGKSKRLADELLAAGYPNVRRYQLGIPVWRALGGVTEIELEGLRHVMRNDMTAVLIDTRDAAAFAAGTLPNARHLPRSGVPEHPAGPAPAAVGRGRRVLAVDVPRTTAALDRS